MSLLIPTTAKGQHGKSATRLVADRAKRVAAWIGFLSGTPIAVALIALLDLDFNRSDQALLALCRSLWDAGCSVG
jgi:hypothetical protein